MTYDPQFNRIYLGTGNGAHGTRRSAVPEAATTCSSAHRRARCDTGEYVWHYSQSRETWDFNASMDIELATSRYRQTAPGHSACAEKRFFYVIDRETGKLISAEKFAR